MIPIGRLTYDTDHAPLTAGLRAAARHYDNTGSVGGFVTARDGQHGIWLAGAVKSDLSREGVRDMRANPPSGDWRMMNRNLELIASLAVPVPGLPVSAVSSTSRPPRTGRTWRSRRSSSPARMRCGLRATAWR